MAEFLWGALTALVSAGFGAFLSYFLGERKLRKELSIALREELGFNNILLGKFKTCLDEDVFLPRFYFNSYLTIRSRGMLVRLPSQVRFKLEEAYHSIQEWDDLSLSTNLGIRNIERQEMIGLKERIEKLQNLIDELLDDLSKAKF